MILTEHLPAAHELRDLFEALGLRDCEVVPTDARAVGGCALATYHTRNGEQLSAAASMDLPLAASVGAAIVGIPPAVVTESVRDGKLDEALVENVHEVANVLASLLHSPVTPAVTLAGVTVPGQEPPPASAPVLTSGHVRSYEVSMRGYPGGTLTLYGRP